MVARLEVENLRVRYPDGTMAVDGVSLAVDPGVHLGVVGESGSGKSSLLRAAGGLLPAGAVRSGEVRLDGAVLPPHDGPAWVEARRTRLGFVLQEARSALNPVHAVLAQVMEAVDPAGDQPRAARRARAEAGLVRVGYPNEAFGAYPHQLSGGLAQRAMLAMALARDPTLVLADEPVASLDAPRRAQVRDVLRAGLAAGGALVEVTHDLDATEHADVLAVMYAARLVELGPADAVRRAPAHWYTKGLLAARPRPGRPPQPIPGAVPALRTPPPGCRFHPRCEAATERCRTEAPPLVALPSGPERKVACHHPIEVSP